jgi:hypothetical protein
MRRSSIATLVRLAALVIVLCGGGCQRAAQSTTPRPVPTPSVQVGSCAAPGRDGVISASPRLERADRDLNGDGAVEAVVVDRALCTTEGNCYWNVFVMPASGSAECPRYAGTFEGAALEPLTTKGDDNMADVRGYWNLHGGRLLLQSYRYAHGGYRLVDALLCMRSADKLDCADSEH